MGLGLSFWPTLLIGPAPNQVLAVPWSMQLSIAPVFVAPPTLPACEPASLPTSAPFIYRCRSIHYSLVQPRYTSAPSTPINFQPLPSPGLLWTNARSRLRLFQPGDSIPCCVPRLTHVIDGSVNCAAMASRKKVLLKVCMRRHRCWSSLAANGSGSRSSSWATAVSARRV